MSEQTCTDKEIKKQLDDMPLEEFEDFLKGVTAKGHEGRPQHAELLSQLKHNVKVQPDEPIQTKATDKDCRTFWKSLNQKDNQTNQHLSSSPADNACSNTTSGSASAGKINSSTTFNGNILYSGTHVANYVHRPKQPTLLGPGSTSNSSSASNKSFSLNSGDQNANQISSGSGGASITTDSVSSSYHPKHNSVHEKLNDYNSHLHVHKSTLNYNNSLDGDPGGVSNRRSQERDTSNKGNTDNTSSRSNSNVPNKNSLHSASTVNNNGDDDDTHQETYLKPTEFTGKLPPQYIGTAVSKIKDLQHQVYPKTLPNSISMTPLHTSSIQQSSSSSHSLSTIGNRDDAFDPQSSVSSSSKSSWDSSRINSRRTESLQLKDGYKSVSSVTSGDAPSYSGTATSSSNEDTYGTVHAASTLPSSAVVSKSPTIISSDGSQLDKPVGGRRGADRKKKSSKNVLRETLINPQEMPGYKGREDIDKLLEFVEGNQTKPKKPSKDKKQREGKLSKGNEKQVLSKAASLDENSLEYGSKKTGDDPISPRAAQNRNSKDVEKKNSANITKSASAICADDSSILKTSDTRITSPVPSNQQESKSSSSSVSSTCSSSFSSTKSASISHPLVNGDSPIPGPKAASKVVAANSLSSGGNKTAPSPSPKNQAEALGSEGSQSSKSQTQTVSSKKSEVQSVSGSIQTVVPQGQGKFTNNDKMKLEDDRSERLDENPYVLVQKKKKRDQRKPPQRETENFHRSHPEQARRDVVRPRRSNTERRKSVGSVPGSENEGSDDDDSVRSLPAGECTPRERIPKPCSSSGGTPQTSYADIARMSKGENEKPSNSATAPAPATTPTPAIPVVPSGPKTPTPSPKTTPQSVVAVGATPEDMNFPALSPPTSSEKTAATPVNTAVWPCRPRAIDTETPSNKDKQGTTINNNTINNNSSKSDDLFSKEDSFPPVVVTIPAATDSQKGSKNKEATTVPGNTKSSTVHAVQQNSINNNNKEVSGKPVSDVPIITKVETSIVQNGVMPRNNVIVDTTPKMVVTNKARLEDKKAKDKSAKPVSEEYISKPAGKTVSENGDHHPTQPVVFCGGKFDSTQLPVGQKIGYEFGFGVIEALNDNTNLSEKSVPEPKPKNFSAVLKRSGSTGTPASADPSEMRSQDQSGSLNHDCTLKHKSVSMPKELPSVSSNDNPPQKQMNQKSNANKNRGQQNLTNNTGGLSKSTSRVASTDAVPSNQPNNRSVTPKALEQSAESVSKPSESVVLAVSKVVQGNSAPKSASSTAVAEPTVSSKPTVEGKLTPKEITPKVNIAQMFVPLKGVSVPSSVQQSNTYMENYISQLTTLKEKGKVSIHRVA